VLSRVFSAPDELRVIAYADLSERIDCLDGIAEKMMHDWQKSYEIDTLAWYAACNH